jgi:hypothetical protein
LPCVDPKTLDNRADAILHRLHSYGGDGFFFSFFGSDQIRIMAPTDEAARGRAVVVTVAIVGVLSIRLFIALLAVVLSESLDAWLVIALILPLAVVVGLLIGRVRWVAIVALAGMVVRFAVDTVSAPTVGAIFTLALFVAALAHTALRPAGPQLKMIRPRHVFAPVPLVFVLWFVWSSANFALMVVHMFLPLEP